MAGLNSPTSRGVPSPSIDEAGGRLAHLELLLKQTEEAINLVRRMLREMVQDEKGGDHLPFAADRTRHELASLPFFRSEQFSRLVGHAGFDGEIADPLNWEVVTRTLIRDRLGSVGHVGAGVLMRLLCAPGEFVSGDDLARAAGVRSSSNRVVKVYICRLRVALTEFGLPPATIETGRRSYRLQAEAVRIILDSLAETPRRNDG
jgi:DNA-binding winged helix-turn-helix (wHTH) protein